MESKKKNVVIALVLGATFALIWVVAIRFITIAENEVHYHANFAMYIDGKAEEFKNPMFYEEVQSCSGNESDNPRGRVHLHQPNNYVIHVHDNAATWGHFFANLGYVLADKAVKAEGDVLVDGQNGKELTLMLNGEKVMSVANKVIKSEDVLLVSYGSEDEGTINQQYESIKKDAGEFNQKYDPAACSGSKKMTVWERLQKAVGL